MLQIGGDEKTVISCLSNVWYKYLKNTVKKKPQINEALLFITNNF